MKCKLAKSWARSAGYDLRVVFQLVKLEGKQAHLLEAAVTPGGLCIPDKIERILALHRDDKKLTPRELELLDYLRRGLVNREIGTALGITEATIKMHLRNILEKLGVADRTEAVAAAYERGLIAFGGE